MISLNGVLLLELLILYIEYIAYMLWLSTACSYDILTKMLFSDLL